LHVSGLWTLSGDTRTFDIYAVHEGINQARKWLYLSMHELVNVHCGL